MSAAACLRILLQPARLEKSGSEALAATSKIAGAYLEAQWAYPKRLTQVSSSSYLLSDPYASTLPPETFQPLAIALQRHLFGAGDSGEVTLLVIEGPQDEMARLSVMPAAETRLLIEGQLGELKSLMRSGIWSLTARKIERLQKPPAAPNADIPPAPQMLASFRGVFLTPKQEFIGNVVSRWSASDVRYVSILDGDTHFPLKDSTRFDEETLGAALDIIGEASSLPSILYLPLNYTSLTKPAQRAEYSVFLKRLERLPRSHLAALLYDVPRDPFYSTIGDVTGFLNERFGAVDLMVTDPGFQVNSLSHSKVRSIAISLPNVEDALRQSALKRFADQRDALRSRQILGMAMNVRSAAEINQCIALKIPLVCGKAVTDSLSKPLGMFPYITDGLPLTEL